MQCACSEPRSGLFLKGQMENPNTRATLIQKIRDPGDNRAGVSSWISTPQAAVADGLSDLGPRAEMVGPGDFYERWRATEDYSA